LTLLSVFEAIVGALDVLTGRATFDGSDIDIAMSDGSLVNLTSTFNLKPLIAVDEALIGRKKTPDIIKYHSILFMGYYMRALNVLISHYGKDPKFAFQLLSQDELKPGTLISRLSGGGESYKVNNENILAIYDNIKDEEFLNREVGHEADIKFSVDDKLGKKGYDLLVEVEITIDRDNKITMPVLISPKVIYTNPENIGQVMDAGMDTSFGAALDRLMSGQSSVIDVLLGTSLIEDERNRRLKRADENDIINILNERKGNVLTGEFAVFYIYSLSIMLIIR